MAEVGRAIGRYQVTGVLGAGTFATVYRAADEALDVTVAIKVLGENWAYDPDVRRRFINEAQLLRRAHGSHVVRVHDIGETDAGQPYFVMDDADRGTVEDRLRELEAAGTPLNAEDVRRLVELLAAGVSEVHRLGVVHRDLKPSNLLLRSGAPTRDAPIEGTTIVRPDEMLLVADLGFARDLDGPTRLTAAVGTEGYMAPEQRDVGGQIDERTDVFACAAILQRVVTGGPPPVPVPEVPADVPSPIREVFAGGLAARPRDRFASADAWCAATVRALGRSGEGFDIDATRAPGPAALASLSKASDTWSIDPDTGTVRRSGRRGLFVGIAAVLAIVLVIGAVALLSRGRGDNASASGATGSDDGPPWIDAVPVDEARVLDPIDVAMGPDGRLYVAEMTTNRVRRVDGDEIGVVAGTGRNGDGGDGGPATAAELSSPTGVGVGPDGTVVVANAFSGVVRAIAPDGTIRTVAGGGEGDVIDVGGKASEQPLAALDAAVAADGTVYVADNLHHVVWRVEPDGTLQIAAGTGDPGYTGDGGDATDAQLMGPTSLFLAADGTLYVSDLEAAVVRAIDSDGVIRTVAGTGEEGFSGDGGAATSAALDGPDGIVVAEDGTLYVSDSRNRRVRRVDPDGIITTYAGNGQEEPGMESDVGNGGPAIDAPLSSPSGLALGSDGSLYVANGSQNRIRVVEPDGTIETYAGVGPAGGAGDNGPAESAMIRAPEALAFTPDGVLFVSESYTGYVRGISPDGIIQTVGGGGRQAMPDGTWAMENEFVIPSGLTIDPRGRLVVSELGAARVRYIDIEGMVGTIAGNGTPGYSGDGGDALLAQITYPYSVATSPDGSILIADGGIQVVRRVGPDGIITTVAGNGNALSGSPNGPATDIGFDQIVAVVAAPDGTMYVSERVGHRVRKISPDGMASAYAGTGTAGFSGDGGPATRARINEPSGLALASDGTLYVAERSGHRVRAIAPDGTITTVAGTGEAGYGGDGGNATAAQLDGPAGLAIGPDGALYIADSNNNRVRRVDAEGIITTFAGAI